MKRGPGRPPKGTATRTLVVLRPANLLARLRRAAEAKGLDVSALLSRLAESYLKSPKGGRR